MSPRFSILVRFTLGVVAVVTLGVAVYFVWMDFDEPLPTADITTIAPTQTNTAPANVLATVYAVGDIADCETAYDSATAALLAETSGPILTLGDTVYDWGTATDFADCFTPTWGPLTSRIRPSVGNHEYNTKGAKPYFDYFGAAAGDPTRGYYSYDIGGWHVIALNSNCWAVGGCNIGSRQLEWLAGDLAANASKCTIAYYHHPAFSSGLHGNQASSLPLWQTLHDNGVDVVLNGHDHHYEQLGPMDRNGVADASGMREFIVGTGGTNLYPTAWPHPSSRVRNNSTHGVLRLSLTDGSYSWDFLPIAGLSFTDSGTGECR